MILYDEHRQPVDLSGLVGRGGEAVVYRLTGQPMRLAKIYEPAPRPNYARKLAWMLQYPPANPTDVLGHPSLAWPDGLLFDSKQQLKGYCMPYIRRTAPLLDVFNPRRRAELLPQFDRRYLYRVARNLAAALSALHASGYVAGDLNESNVLVTSTALVSLIDVDSFQVIEHHGDREIIHPCPVGKLEYTPPELQGKKLAEVIRYPEHDAFGLGVLIFQLLMEGSHPFRAQWLGSGDPPSLEARIASGAFPYTSFPSQIVLPPKNAPALESLHPRLVELTRRCFLDGHREPAYRPTPEAWERAIAEAEQSLVQCELGHFYPNHLLACPDCARVARLPAGQRPAAQLPARKPAQSAPPQARPGTGAGGRAANQPPAGQPHPAPQRQSVNPNPAIFQPRPAHPAPPAQPVQPAATAQASPVVQPAPAATQTQPYPGMPPNAWTTTRAARAAQWLRTRSANANPAPASSPVIPGPAAWPPAVATTGPVLAPAVPARPMGLGRWLWRRTTRSLFIGGVNGALGGALPGMMLGAAAGMSGDPLAWAVLVPLGGLAGGFLRGWQPGRRVGLWIDQSIGWEQVLQGAGMVLGGVIGAVLGLVFGWWAILPIFLGPILGAKVGREMGRKLWRVGIPFGWPQLWAGVAAVSMGALGWVVAALAGSGGLSNLGPFFQAWLVQNEVRPLLTTMLSASFTSALGGLVSGTFTDLVAGLLGLSD